MKEKMLSPGLEVGGGLVPDESEEPRRHDKLGCQTSLTKRSLSWVILFRQFFDLASGTSVRSTVGLILVIKSFNAFNFYYSKYNRQLCPYVAMDKVGISIGYVQLAMR